MEWHQLENFIAVAELKHFTKAAKKQMISQPALSRSIIKLEQELGIPLFIRDGRTITLTRYGTIFLKKAQQAQARIREGIEEIQEVISPDGGEISVAFLHTLGANLIPQLIVDYKKIYPNVTFQLFEGANNYLLEKVEKGLADLCLTSPPVPRENIEWTILTTEPLYLVVPYNHYLANQSSVSISSLENEDFISFKKGYGLRYIFDQICTHLQLKPTITFEGEEVPTIAGFIAVGLGIAVLPKTKELDESKMKLLPIDDYPCNRSIAIATLSDHYLSPATRKFKSFVINYFNK